MILFDLKCGANHVFEAWFRDGASYDRQAEAGEIACPLCGDTAILKAPMAPRLSTGARDPAATPTRDGSYHNGAIDKEKAAKAMAVLRELRREIERSSEYVGDRFPEEVRKIHYGEAEERRVYGEASREEAKELREEGIAVVAIPWLPRTDS